MAELNKNKISIIGGGFTGLNCGLLLGKEGINCEIYSTGYGASNLWMGTFDFLNYSSSNIKDSFLGFKNRVQNHPYHHFEYSEIKSALMTFFKEFPEIKYFEDQDKLTNREVLTSIGTKKPCLGIWGSLFHNFESLKNETKVILIGFTEFNNSALYLVKKGLEEHYLSKFYLLNLSFNELYAKLEEKDLEKGLPSKLSEFRLGRFFDSNFDKMDVFSEFIKMKIKKQIGEISTEEVSFVLFPPILGIDKNQRILQVLSTALNSECHELIALSPSLIANRLLNRYESKLKKYGVKVNKGKSLIALKKKQLNGQQFWSLKYEDKKGDTETIVSKFVIFSNGTMFQAGIFDTLNQYKTEFGKLGIEIPNDLGSNFQLIYIDDDNPTNLYVSGSALYIFTDQISDEIEIKYGTGLGLSIISSYKTVKNLMSDNP